MKEQIPEKGHDGWRPRTQDPDWPVFAQLSVKVLVRAQLHGCLHGLDLGSAVLASTSVSSGLGAALGDSWMEVPSSHHGVARLVIQVRVGFT